MWALLAGEVGDIARRVGRSPVARIWVIATSIAVALLVGLSGATPGPVVAEWLRLTAAAIVVGLASAAMWVGAERWGRSRPAGDKVVTWAIVGSLAMFVLVGLHHQTPGPVLEAQLRWGVAAMLLTGAALWQRRTRRGR